MSETKYTLKAFRDDHVGPVHERDVLLTEDHLILANEIADRFGLGEYLSHNMSGKYNYEDGEILTHFRLTPLI
jgi:hypothetical protein